MKKTGNPFGDGKLSTLQQISNYIDNEIVRVRKRKNRIPAKVNLTLACKRATLAGNIIALTKLKVYTNEKIKRIKTFNNYD